MLMVKLQYNYILFLQIRHYDDVQNVITYPEVDNDIIFSLMEKDNKIYSVNGLGKVSVYDSLNNNNKPEIYNISKKPFRLATINSIDNSVYIGDWDGNINKVDI